MFICLKGQVWMSSGVTLLCGFIQKKQILKFFELKLKYAPITLKNIQLAQLF